MKKCTWTLAIASGLVAAYGQRSGPVSISPSSLAFSATVNGSAPAARTVRVTAEERTRFTVSVSAQGNWLSVTPSGVLSTDQTLTVLASPRGLGAGSYSGAVVITSQRTTTRVGVSLAISGSGGGGTPPPTGGGFKLIGWNDLGMHCFDGKDYSVFAVLPPYNTIHAHLLDSSGALIKSGSGYTVTYQAINDPLTNTTNKTSVGKSNFWQYAQALGFGALAPDMGLKGFAMPGASNTPQAMKLTASDNTWLAEGIPVMPYADAAGPPYPTNYFPMMRLAAKNASGTVVATTDIVLPTSDEMTCSVCHSSAMGTLAARPASGWVNNPDPAKDVKLNILRKHDDRFRTSPLFQRAAIQTGISTAGLEASSAAKPLLCAACHGSNALSLAGVSGVPPLTTSMHGLHAGVIDPRTGQTMESSTTRESCYTCHPGPKTQCVRGAMANITNASGARVVECQSCHGPMSALAVSTRQGWLDEPSCQGCHTGTATSNSGQIVYNSVFSSGTTPRTVTNQTFATNVSTLYRFSSGHGGLQCEACHGSTHAEFPTNNVNDNLQSTNLQGHAGSLIECTACHNSVPNTVTGGPHGMHPVGATWVSRHPDIAEGNAAQCQACHGIDYRGTILSKVKTTRTLAGRTFAAGTAIGCYSCHNGPNGD